METTEVLEMMDELKLCGTKSAYDETLATALKRKHEPQQLVGDLLKAEISEKQARSILSAHDRHAAARRGCERLCV